MNPDPQNTPHPALGIDFGTSRIGIAATDPLGIMPHPVETLPVSENHGIPRIVEISTQRQIRTLIIGLPLRLDGSEGTSAQKVRHFAHKLATALPHLPIHFIDESYTTADASEKLRQAGRKAHQQKNLIDQAAAVEILNRWMEETS